MPITTIKDFQSWRTTKLKPGEHQKDKFDFATETDTWVNWVLLFALLLVLTLEVVLSKELPSSFNRSLGTMSPTTAPTVEKARQITRQINGAYSVLNFKR